MHLKQIRSQGNYIHQGLIIKVISYDITLLLLYIIAFVGHMTGNL